MNRRFSVACTALAVAALWLSAAAARADEDADDPNTGALSIAFDSSFTTAYIFRGILNVRDGLIWQPSLEAALNLFESEDGVVRSVDAGIGTWLSVQSVSALGIPSSDGLFEADFYPSLSLSWAGGVTSSLTYYFYTGDDFVTVEEIAVDLSYDDSDLLGAFSLSPTATFAFETHNSSLVSSLFNGKGGVLVLGVSPGYTFNEDGDWSVALSFPINLALSLYDYYRGEVNGVPQDDTFGYASMALHATVPISCIPPRFGAWSVTNGFDIYFLDDVLEDINQDDGVYPVWTSSISMEY